MQLKPGSRLRSATGTTEVVVVRAPAEPVDLRCGGLPMLTAGAPAGEPASALAGFDGGSQIGKRYASEEAGIEVLCTKAGPDSLSIGETVLEIKGSKPLPSSD